jgi:topoisomerase-4 subunit B
MGRYTSLLIDNHLIYVLLIKEYNDMAFEQKLSDLDYFRKLWSTNHQKDVGYLLLEQTVDDMANEYVMEFGRQIIITVNKEQVISIRHNGRGLPFACLDECTELRRGMVPDSKFREKLGYRFSTINAISDSFNICSHRGHKVRTATFLKGRLQEDFIEDSFEPDSWSVSFHLDQTLFENFNFKSSTIISIIRDYSYTNAGLTFNFNGLDIVSPLGLKNLIQDKLKSESLFDIIRLNDESIEVAFTYSNEVSEEYYSFVNNKYTEDGGIHLNALIKHIVRTIKEFLGINISNKAICIGLKAAISIYLDSPYYNNSSYNRLIKDYDVDVDKFIGDFIHSELTKYLHDNPQVAETIFDHIERSAK